MNEASEIGRRGEEAAVEYLRREGFRICARNWRNGRYEIDVVACRCLLYTSVGAAPRTGCRDADVAGVLLEKVAVFPHFVLSLIHISWFNDIPVRKPW